MRNRILMTEGQLRKVISESVRIVLREYYEDEKFSAFKKKVDEIISDAKEIWFGWQRQRAGGRQMDERYSGNLMEWVDYLLHAFDYFINIKEQVRDACPGFEDKIDNVYLTIEKYKKKIGMLKRRIS